MLFQSFKNAILISVFLLSYGYLHSATQEETDIARWNMLESTDQLGTLSDEIRALRKSTGNNLPTHLINWLKKTTQIKQHPILIYRLIDHLALRGSLTQNDLKVIATLLIIGDIHTGQDSRCIYEKEQYAQAVATRNRIRSTLGKRLSPYLKNLNQEVPFKDTLAKIIKLRCPSRESANYSANPAESANYSANPAWILQVTSNNYVNLYFTSLWPTGGLTFSTPKPTTLQFYDQRKEEIHQIRNAFIPVYLAAHQEITNWEQFFNEIREEPFVIPQQEKVHGFFSSSNDELSAKEDEDFTTGPGAITQIFNAVGIPKFW